MKTLICIFGQTRAWELTYQKQLEHLIKPNNADLLLAIGCENSYDKNNPFYQNAKYKFIYPEPINYETAYDDVCKKTFKKNPTWRKLLDFPENWLSGLNNTNGSCSLHYFYKWWIWHNIQDKIIHEYDWFVISRSDQYYMYDHLITKNLDPNKIYIPVGDDWGGLHDRHMIVHKNHIEKVTRFPLEDILKNTDELYQYITHNVKGKKIANSEQYIQVSMKKHNIPKEKYVIRFPRMMFCVKGQNDPTRWSKGWFDPRVNLIVKYPSEYWWLRDSSTKQGPVNDHSKNAVKLFGNILNLPKDLN